MLPACSPKILEALQAFYYPAIFEVCLEHFNRCMLPACSPKMLEALQAFYYPAILKFVLNTSLAACCQPAAPKCWKPCKSFTTLPFLKFVFALLHPLHVASLQPQNSGSPASLLLPCYFGVCLEHFIHCMLPACSPKMLEALQAFYYPAILKFVLNTSSAACCQPAAPKFWKPCTTTLLLFEVCLEHFISCMLPGCSPKMLEALQAFCYPATLKFVLNTSTAACCQPAAPKCWERCNRFTTLLF